MVSVTSYADSMCMSGSGSAAIGPYSSSYWCKMGNTFGIFKVYGRAARQCSTEPANVTLVQVDFYSNPSCAGDVMQIETLAVDVCI